MGEMNFGDTAPFIGMELDSHAHRPASISRPSTPPRISSRRAFRVSTISNPPQSSQPEPARGDMNFSRLRARHASDPQLSTRFRNHAHHDFDMSDLPPVPACAAPAPVIGYTSPKRDSYEKSTGGIKQLWSRQPSFRTRGSSLVPTSDGVSIRSISRKSIGGRQLGEQSPRPSSSNYEGAPPPYGEPNRTSISLFGHGRPSESSTLEDSIAYATTTTTHTTVSTTTTFFKIPRRKKKQPDLLFPLPASLRPQPSPTSHSPGAISPSRSSEHSPHANTPVQAGHLRPLPHSHSSNEIPLLRSTTPNAAMVASSNNYRVSVPTFGRQDSTASAPCQPVGTSFPGTLHRRISGTRESFGSRPEESNASSLTVPASGRNSSASITLGRNSIAGLRGLTSRLRHTPDVHMPRNASPGGILASQHDSLSMSRETLVMPEREEGETAGKFYARMEKDIPKRTMAVLLSKSSNPFNHDVLRSLMRTFKFYEVPLDISMRTLLWEVALPGESQQIDRVISAFAERYHECNPHVFRDLDQVYLAAYSMVILHSDLYNKNNKRKMQRGEYQKNTGGHGIDEEILGYFYDNINYTEFITHDPAEDDADFKAKAKLRKSRSTGSRIALNEAGKSAKPDPYDSIIEPKLDLDKLGPSLKNVINLEDTFRYLGSADWVDVNKLRETFSRYGSLEIISARSRPGAFTQDSTIQNPQHAQPGVVSIRVVKVGVIWRKDIKRKKTQRPWQPWGALLTSSQLYFFRNHSWIRNLMGQFEASQKQGNKHLIFKPALEEFKPDASVQMHGSVALQDKSYDKHKNAFVLARQDEYPYEEILLADNEFELNDWLVKINYAATFHWDTQMDHKHARQSDIAARANAIATRLSAVDEQFPSAREKLEDNLRNARHLQILAPLTSKGRSELLAYGARIAHRIRWSRYCTWRLQCQKDLLSGDIGRDVNHKLEKKSIGIERSFSNGKFMSPRFTRGPSALSRLNSKASALMSPQRHKAVKGLSPRLSSSSSLNRGGGDFDGGTTQTDVEIAIAHSTQNESSHGPSGSFLLPPLHLGSGALDIAPDSASDRLASRPTSSSVDSVAREGMARQTSLGSVLSRTDKPSGDENLPNLLTPPRLREFEHGNDLELVPSLVVESAESDTEHAPVMGSPDSRTKHRRSLHRTLRETRDIGALNQHRSRKGKESVSSIGAEDGTGGIESEGITRGTGSFTIHGKKASVITFGSEWQHISAEDRLRVRRQAQSGDVESAGQDQLNMERRFSTDERSLASAQTQRSSYHSILGGESSIGSDTADGHYSTPPHTSAETVHQRTEANNLEQAPLKDSMATSAAKRLFDAVRHENLGVRPQVENNYKTAKSLRTFFEDASQSSDDYPDGNEHRTRM